ncbi:MAG: DNA polymerase III subunit gamma/tau [Gammaproteobacteria bacterium]|nr:DNA polymerase III subunit gamma/tau [Gammaproteobacteria bacterium]
MAYQVLARKFRPNQLGEVVGQDNVVKALTNALITNRLHHAYLFTGTRGVGKTTLARILAKCLNCELGVTANPCGVCESCRSIQDGSFLDLHEVDAASRTGVEDTRAMLENVQWMPTTGRYKVYLIDEVHMLSTASFNSLLKTLEEPPDHVKFILATTNPKKVLATVLSRCLQFHLRNISPPEIAEQLIKILGQEEITYDEESVKSIARASQGSMRDALSITDQAIARCGDHLDTETVVDMLGTARSDEVILLLTKLAEGDREGLFSVVQDLASRSVDFADVLDALAIALHDLAMCVSTGAKLSNDLDAFSEKFDAVWLQSGYQILIMGGRDLQYAPSPQVGFEMTMIRLFDFAPHTAKPNPVERKSTNPKVQPSNNKNAAPRSASTQSSETKSVEPVSQSTAVKPVSTVDQPKKPRATKPKIPKMDKLPARVQQASNVFNAKVVKITPLDPESASSQQQQ